MNNKTFYIFRHGETDRTKNNIPYPLDTNDSVPILEEGKPVIRKLANYLKDCPTDIYYRSHFLRCKQTADIITEITGKVFVEDDRIYDHQPGEGFDHLHERVLSFYNFVNESNHQSIAVCTHGEVISGLKFLATTGKFLPEQQGDFPRPGILLIIKDKKVEEIDFN